jgi:hypothetical protein
MNTCQENSFITPALTWVDGYPGVFKWKLQRPIFFAMMWARLAQSGIGQL